MLSAICFTFTNYKKVNIYFLFHLEVHTVSYFSLIIRSSSQSCSNHGITLPANRNIYIVQQEVYKAEPTLLKLTYIFYPNPQ